MCLTEPTELAISNNAKSSAPTSDVEAHAASSGTELASETSELDSDMEQGQMIDKYVQLQTRLYRIDPKFVTPAPGKASKERNNRPTAKSVQDSASTRKLARTQAKVAKLCSDILFDKQLADLHWAPKYVELCREDATRRRFGIQDLDCGGVAKQPNADTRGKPDTEDADMMLGDLFTSLPDNPGSPTNDHTMLSNLDGGGPIEMRNFGTWSGMSPRRVLEEACKARQVQLRCLGIC